MNQETSTAPPARCFSLPVRTQKVDLEWVKSFADRMGYDRGVAAAAYSRDEWMQDEFLALELADQMVLSDEELELLLEQFCERNRSVWGEHSVCR